MGFVSFSSTVIPVAGPPRDVVDEAIAVDDRIFRFCAATIGNPHCVILCDLIDAGLAQRYGPTIERDPRFPNRTNVQFMQVVDRSDHSHRDLGARRWLHVGLGQQQLRGRSRGKATRPV